MTPSLAIKEVVACRISIGGVVQGVGFRPFVYRTAVRHHIAGWVLNGDAGVEIHAEGLPCRVTAFCEELRSSPPPTAKITSFESQPAIAAGATRFEIRDSRHAAAPTVRISPDVAVCDDCLRELRDPADRRYRYPYINCTNCGPRYSIIHRLPYDRAATTMADWPLCEECRAEYEDPANRRYHAQPVCCERCGPTYYLQIGDEKLHFGEAAIRDTAVRLALGEIVAVKGLGGFHLACDARNELAVTSLRNRKFRKEKPFAVMVRTLDDARELMQLSAAHERLLTDVARPIVLAPAKIALPGVAPDNSLLGVMLPYAPLHHLLFEFGAPSPLVLTSANRSSEPIPYRDDDARRRLAEIADAFLIGERPIARRVDDSVTAIRGGGPFLIRRARGFAPQGVCTLPTTEPILALGGDLKNTIALVVNGEVIVSQHLGDLADYDTRTAFAETVNDLLAMYDIDRRELTVVHDRHPHYVSTQFAATLPAKRTFAVQHHHAHIASVLAEHQVFDDPVLGVALDGTGYGEDGSIWGCELFAGSLRDGFQRVASLRPVPMPGGDAAAKFPVQAAAGFLAELDDLPDLTAAPFHFPRQFSRAMAMIERRVRCFPCSSAGRLFDAAAALLGFTRETTFEGQAAIWLEEQAANVERQPPYPFPDLDHRPLMQAMLRDRLAGRAVPEIASAFHAALAAELAAQIQHLCAAHQFTAVALSGGVFQNELLWTWLLAELELAPQLRVLANRQIPVNDGGLCVGQAALAATCYFKCLA